MRATAFRGPALLFFLVGPLCLIAAGVVTGRSAAEDGEKDKAKTPTRSKSPAALPPGSILGVFDNVADALKMLPRAVLMTPEKYRALLDEIDRLKKQLDRPVARTPSRLLLKGKVEGNLVHLSATYEFETEQAGEVVRLGCGLAQATGVSLDGRTPRLRGPQGRARGREEDEGFLVDIVKPGDHELTLDVVLAVASTAAGQGFTLDLPRAAVTTLQLALPVGAREVRLAGKPVAESLLTLKGNELSGSLGPAGKLELAWRSAGAGASGAVLAAEGVVVTRLDRRDSRAAELSTEATLTLRVLSGQTKQWRLLVPLRAEVKLGADDEARVEKIDVADQKQSSLRTIHLREASAVPLTITISQAQMAPKPGSGRSIGVGPFSVLGAVRQSGSVLVTSTLSDWHLEFTPHADLTRRGATEEELKREPNLVAAFRYGPGDRRRASLAWLDVEAETVRGQIKTRSAHVLTLAVDADGPRWHVQTTITVTPRWGDVDRFVVQMPSGCSFNEEGSFPLPDRVRGLTPDPTGRSVEFRLARSGVDTTLTPFSIRVEGTYARPGDLKGSDRASLSLPRAIGTIEQDGSITVQVPAGVELVVPAATPGLDLTRQTTHELAWRYPRRAPEKLDLAWQPYRAPVQVASLVDVTLSVGQARVRQELRYLLPDTRVQSPARLPLRVPRAVAARVQLREGGRLVDPGPDGFAAVVPTDARQPVLVLEYAAPLARAVPGEPVPIPLVIPEQTTRGETRVRVWCEGGPLPAAAPGWSEQNLEVVPGRNQLPALVVRSDRVDQPLALVLGQGEPTLPALVERALARVGVATNGVQAYHVSYRLVRLATRSLDLELPAPLSIVALEVRLDGRLVATEPVATDRAEQRGRLVRLRLSPELVKGPAVLDVSYRLDPSRVQASPLTTSLLLPRLAGEPAGVPTRWQITVPGNRVVLAPEAGPGTPTRWGWRGWLPAPRPGVTAADLEHWFAGDGAPSRSPEEGTPSLVLWHDGPAGLQLTHVPQQAWLLGCSLILVLLGLVAWRLSFPSAESHATTAAWLVVLVVFLAVLAAMLLRPSLAGQVAYGCLPGLAVLVVLGAVQWLLHERYRRQIVFLPSFTRPRGGSSLLRPDPARPGTGEPSTVDVPRAVGSSINRTV